ncbi:MAG: pantetheine-phosphate adenylyltransferase [Clostridia bacterium]
MKCAVTGSFDPITVGHIEVICEAKKLFDTVVVLMLVNEQKECFFSVEQRLKFIQLCTKDIGVEVAFYKGYTADYCKQNNIKTIVRGVRNQRDYNYEMEMAQFNKTRGDVDTIFVYAKRFKEVSSTRVREQIINNKFSNDLPKEILDSEEFKKIVE